MSSVEDCTIRLFGLKALLNQAEGGIADALKAAKAKGEIPAADYLKEVTELQRRVAELREEIAALEAERRVLLKT